MQPEDKDSAYLWDMLDAAQTAAQFTSGITIESRDGTLKFGFLRENGLLLLATKLHEETRRTVGSKK